ncbi:hypothetical protein P8452_30612 [Trifolium repens]|nr:hypothetical protein P8452_30612 [Trifolium repens]
MLYPCSFPCSNHASSNTKFPSPLLLINAKPFQYESGKSPTFRFPHKPFNLPSLRSAIPTRAVPSLPLLDNEETKSMNKFFEMEFQVRDYELDQYGVAHNSVYACYCQEGRHEFLKSIGIDCDALASSGDYAFAISELSIKFLGPLRNGDKFVVKVRISSYSAARVYFEHFIYKLPNQEPILEARSTTLMLNKNYRPIRIPADIKAKVVKSIESEDDDS